MDRSLAPAAVFALGLVLAALIFGLFFYNARHARDTVDVTGAATQVFEADVAKWRLSLSRGAGSDGLAAAYDALHADVETVLGQLRALGLPDSALTIQPAGSSPRYDQDGQLTGYDVQQSVAVVTPRVDAVEGLALNPGRLQTGGAVLQGSNLEYFYEGLPALKRSLLAAATADARARAAEIAGSSDAEVGTMVAARAGVFQITEPYSTDVEAYGLHSTATRRQEITVTVHATFTLD